MIKVYKLPTHPHVGDGRAVYPGPETDRDYAEWADMELVDTICLRVMGWRHTFLDMDCDDTRPLEAVGAFHPEDERPRWDGGRYYPRPPVTKSLDACLKAELRLLQYASSHPATRMDLWKRYVDQLDTRMSENTGSDRCVIRAGSVIEGRAALVVLTPPRDKCVAMLRTLDEVGIDYLKLD